MTGRAGVCRTVGGISLKAAIAVMEGGVRRGLQECFGQSHCRANDVLAAVEHDQEMLVAQPGGQSR